MSDPSDRKKAFEALLGKFAAENPTAPVIVSTDAAEIGEFVVRNAPAGTAQKWLADVMAIVAPASRWPSPGVTALFLAGVVTALGLIWGIFFTPAFLPSLAEPGMARGLITFLFAFATIAVVIISVIAVFWVKIDEVAQRGALAKEVLTILIGIMGTILGFYFGAELTTAAPPPAAIETPIQ